MESCNPKVTDDGPCAARFGSMRSVRQRQKRGDVASSSTQLASPLSLEGEDADVTERLVSMQKWPAGCSACIWGWHGMRVRMCGTHAPSSSAESTREEWTTSLHHRLLELSPLPRLANATWSGSVAGL
eukprot:356530-Chlamydomonas_euryale.AAC.1